VHLQRHGEKQDGQYQSAEVGVHAEHHREATEQQEQAREQHRRLGRRDLLELCVAGHRLGLGEVVEAACEEDEREEHSADNHDDIHVISPCVNARILEHPNHTVK